MNLYEYAVSNPVNWIDPSGLDVFIFWGDEITYYDDNMNPVKSWPATSGKPGFSASDKNKGPIPSGGYTIDPNKIDKFNPYDPSDWDWSTPEDRTAWGNTRVPIDPVSGTGDLFGRGGFFVHGGVYPGSIGCIDVGQEEEDFFDFLDDFTEPIPLYVP